MPRTTIKDYPPRQTRLKTDEDSLADLSEVPNDADDQSDAGRPTTDHEAEGWRTTPPAKP